MTANRATQRRAPVTGGVETLLAAGSRDWMGAGFGRPARCLKAESLDAFLGMLLVPCVSPSC